MNQNIVTFGNSIVCAKSILTTNNEQQITINDMSIEVFVYGTLKPGEANYQHYCEGKVIRAIEAYTWGQLFHLPLLGYPGMTPGDNKVKGVVLTFRDPFILASLDKLEDYEPNRSIEENEYQRQKISVYTVTEEPLGRVWGYVMSLEKVRQLNGILVPSGLWQGTKISQSILDLRF